MITHVMMPIVKNITISNIDKIDSNQDGQITPDEIHIHNPRSYSTHRRICKPEMKSIEP